MIQTYDAKLKETTIIPGSIVNNANHVRGGDGDFTNQSSSIIHSRDLSNTLYYKPKNFLKPQKAIDIPITY